MNHQWIPSTLGHGNRMCSVCKCTDLEAAALGMADQCQAVPASKQDEPKPFTFLYLNHRKKVELRTVTPKSLRWGTNEWYPEAQWLLLAYCHDRKADREFAMKRINV